eukprot:scaffold482264_cov18-Prasinocladus_malaysianus.AAC.1
MLVASEYTLCSPNLSGLSSTIECKQTYHFYTADAHVIIPPDQACRADDIRNHLISATMLLALHAPGKQAESEYIFALSPRAKPDRWRQQSITPFSETMRRRRAENGQVQTDALYVVINHALKNYVPEIAGMKKHTTIAQPNNIGKAVSY